MCIEQRKKAIVLASFGVADADMRKSYIDRLTNNVRAAFPDHVVWHVFTSGRIREKIKREAPDIFSLPEILERLKSERYQKVLIQPTHLSDGMEYRKKILGVAESYRKNFPHFIIGRPAILPGENDAAVFAALKWQAIPKDEAEEVVFMGHGSIDFHNPIYEKLQMYVDRHCSFISIGVLEASDYPNYEQVLARLQAKRRRSVYLMPLLFTAGMHVLQDLSGAERTSWKSRLMESGFSVRVYERGLGVNPLFQQIYMLRLNS